MNNYQQDDDAWSMVSEDGPIPGAFAPPDMPDSEVPAAAPTQPSLPPALPPSPPPAPAPMPRPIFDQSVAPQTAPQARAGQVARRTPAANAHYMPRSNPDVTQRGNMLGFATVAAGVGAVAGTRFGGLYGGIAGTLFAGAATNAYRAFMHYRSGTEAGRNEAMVSGTWSIVAAGLGGYLLYMTKGKRASTEMTPNKQEPEEPCLTKNGRRSCGIRAIV